VSFPYLQVEPNDPVHGRIVRDHGAGNQRRRIAGGDRLRRQDRGQGQHRANQRRETAGGHLASIE